MAIVIRKTMSNIAVGDLKDWLEVFENCARKKPQKIDAQNPEIVKNSSRMIL